SGRFSLTKCQYCVARAARVRPGNVCVACCCSLLRRNSESARRPGSLRISDMGAGQEPQIGIIPAPCTEASTETNLTGIDSSYTRSTISDRSAVAAPDVQHSLPVYQTAEIRQIEALADPTVAPPGLMERAGMAAAELAR